jgi:hypothetical protein
MTLGGMLGTVIGGIIGVILGSIPRDTLSNELDGDSKMSWTAYVWSVTWRAS